MWPWRSWCPCPRGRAKAAQLAASDERLAAVRRALDDERRQAMALSVDTWPEQLARRGADLPLGIRVVWRADADLWRANVTVAEHEFVATVVGEHHRSAHSAYLTAVWELGLAVHHYRLGMATRRDSV